MKFGFIPTEGGKYFDEALEEAIYGEELGFDSVWLEEHHSIRNHYWPSPLMALAGIATRTTLVLLGTDIVVLPFYHPVRAAEDMAMLDVISGGRAIFGAAIGYRPPEFELYDVSLDDRGSVVLDAVIKGDTVKEVLDYVEFDAETLVRKLRHDVELAVRQGNISYEESGRLLQFYEDGLQGYTYLEEPKER